MCPLENHVISSYNVPWIRRRQTSVICEERKKQSLLYKKEREDIGTITAFGIYYKNAYNTRWSYKQLGYLSRK